MKQYFTDKKYYIKKAIKVAEKCNNEEAVGVLKMLQRQNNVCSIDFIKRINNIKIDNVDLFNIEGTNK